MVKFAGLKQDTFVSKHIRLTRKQESFLYTKSEGLMRFVPELLKKNLRWGSQFHSRVTSAVGHIR